MAIDSDFEQTALRLLHGHAVQGVATLPKLGPRLLRANLESALAAFNAGRAQDGDAPVWLVVPEAELPGVSPAERERLVVLMEECAEVQQRAAKILRHGFVSERGDNNREGLEVELGCLQWAMSLCCRAGDVARVNVDRHAATKPGRAKDWLRYQDLEGAGR